MIMASDRLASIREPTLTLDFNIDEHGQEKHISVELTSDELKNLISSLESANKVSCSVWFMIILLGRILQLSRGKGHKRTSRSYLKVPYLTHPPICIWKTATALGSPYSFLVLCVLVLCIALSLHCCFCLNFFPSFLLYRFCCFVHLCVPSWFLNEEDEDFFMIFP